MNIHTESHLPIIEFAPSYCAESPNPEKPKILALAHSTNLAGAQLALASLIKNTIEQFDWTVVCPGNGPFVEKIDPYAEALVTEKFPWWCRGDAYTASPTDFRVENLNEVLDGVDYDYSLTNTITVPWLAYNSLMRDKPHLWYIHEYGDIDHNLSFALGYNGTIDYINKLSDAVMTVSPSVGEHLLEHGASSDTLKYISQSFDVDAYLEIATPTDEKELLILGSIKRSKGQLDALIGFNSSTIRDSHRLTIAGPVTDPQYASSIGQYIDANDLRDRVNFIPERVDAVEQMKRASAVMVCSRNEALGRTTLEALAAGRTVIGSRGGGTEMLLSDARGILYDGSVVDLTRKLDGLGQDTDTLLQSVQARRQYTVDNFSPINERNDFLKVLLSAEHHHSQVYSSQLRHQIGKTGIFNAMKAVQIIA